MNPTDEKIKNEANFVIEVFRYASENNLDINNKEDVTNAVQAVDSTQVNEDHIEALMPILGIVANMIEKEANFDKARVVVEESLKLVKEI